jgi:hypothetical protein
MSDFSTKTRPCQIVVASNEKNAIFIAVNHSLISFEKDAYKGNKKIPTRITLIRAMAPGWNSAPYKKNQKVANRQKLTEFVGGPIPALRFYSFEKVANNSEKGPRCDDISFELHAGHALTYWMDEKRLGEIRDTIPTGLLQIPAFTVCEVELAPSNNEAVAKGYACTIKKIKPRDFTLHSCLPDIEAFPPSFADATAALLKHQTAQSHLGSSLVVNEPSFFIHVADKAYIHEDADQPDYVTLVNTGIDPVDIPLPTLMQYTNSTKKAQACALLEMAIAQGALQLFVIHNDYWKGANTSALRGIPIVNTELMLQSIVPSRVGEQAHFPTPNTIAVEDVTYNIQIHVDPVSGDSIGHSALTIVTHCASAGTLPHHQRTRAPRPRLRALLPPGGARARLQAALRPHLSVRRRNPPLLGWLLRRLPAQDPAGGGLPQAQVRARGRVGGVGRLNALHSRHVMR